MLLWFVIYRISNNELIMLLACFLCFFLNLGSFCFWFLFCFKDQPWFPTFFFHYVFVSMQILINYTLLFVFVVRVTPLSAVSRHIFHELLQACRPFWKPAPGQVVLLCAMQLRLFVLRTWGQLGLHLVLGNNVSSNDVLQISRTDASLICLHVTTEGV